MTIVNFTVNKPLEEKIETVISKLGLQSKAEFFRFAALNYIQSLNVNLDPEEELLFLETKLSRLVSKKYADKKLPSIKSQLEDL